MAVNWRFKLKRTIKSWMNARSHVSFRVAWLVDRAVDSTIHEQNTTCGGCIIALGSCFTTVLSSIISNKDGFAIQVARSYVLIKYVRSSAQAIVLLEKVSALPG